MINKNIDVYFDNDGKFEREEYTYNDGVLFTKGQIRFGTHKLDTIRQYVLGTVYLWTRLRNL